MSDMSFTESNDFEGKTVTLIASPYQKNLIFAQQTTKGKNSADSPLKSRIQTFLRNAFLPEGYPDSVSKDYWSYQIWDTVQAFASSISGSLATQVSRNKGFTKPKNN